MNQPQTLAQPIIKFEIMLGRLAGRDWGHLFRKFEFQGMVSGGYIIRAELHDANYNILTALVEEGYFKETRDQPIPVKFQILSGTDATFPQTATRPQVAILVSVNDDCRADVGVMEFVAVDPPSWYLNKGNAAGKVYKGRVDQVIKQVVADYAPPITLDISKTTDSSENKWWMMRLDPQTFISSFIDWSASITQRKTNWLVEVDGYNLTIKEQALLQSRPRGYYRYFGGLDVDTISRMSLISDNALSVVQTKLVTAGLSAVSGRYLDSDVDKTGTIVVVGDKTTSNKQVAKIGGDGGFSKPSDGAKSGWSQIVGVPEIYSAGDLGLGYDEYIDGRPRRMWLDMTNALLRAKFTVLGHGEWSDCKGLGVDTIFVKWTKARDNEDGGSTLWWPTGNWLVYGFKHDVRPGRWMTDLFTARFDHDAQAKKVGGL